MKHFFKTAFVLMSTVIAASFFSAPGFAAESMTSGSAADYAAIKTLIVKYAHVYDARDVEGYVSIFTEDAVFTFTGNTLNGKAEIREFITNVANSPEPVMKGYHVITNTLIEFVSATEAQHRSYWQVISGPEGGPFTVGNMGYYDDVVIKQDGQWLIQSRNIPQ